MLAGSSLQTVQFMTFIAKKMSETNCASCHSNHRPPHLIFCEEDNGKGGGEVDNHEEDDDISNSLGSIDDRDPRPTKTHHNHEDEDDKHLLRKGKKEVEKRTNDNDKDDDGVKQGDKNSLSDNNPESSVSATLSSDLIHAADAVTEQTLSPAIISTSNTSTTAAAAAATNALITTATIDEELEPPVGTNKCNHTSSSTKAPTPHDDDYYQDITERNELPVLHVGRVIGKGGEMIRDLQARSGCRIDVDQSVADPHAPRHIIYHGQNQEDIDFAKRLVAMVCQSNNNIVEDREQHLPHHNYHPIELPLGKAVRRYIQVHKSVVGRIIGRGGDMIRDLQIKSHARIQVDHKGEYSVGVGGGGDGGGGEEEEAIPTSSSPTSTNELEFRQVMITGTEESVQRAEEMILHLSNRHNDEFESRHQQQHDQQQSLDFTSVDTGMDPYWDRRSFGLRVAPFTYVSGYGGNNSPLPLQRGSFPVLPWNASGYFPNPLLLPATSTMIETEIIPCARENIGHVIGRRGVTVNDLQWRSGCNIQLDRRGCKISISGSRQGIELAKNMIFNIFECGPTHMYAGGRQEQLIEQEQTVVPHHEELVPPASCQSAANQYQYPGEGVYSRPMIPQRRGCYPRLPQAAMMYGQLPQQQVFPPQELLQPPIQDPSPALPEAAAEVSYLWREAITMDGRMYYYNTNTMETRWDKPE